MYYKERFRTMTYPGVKPDTYEIGDCGTVRNKRRQTDLSCKKDKDGYIILSLYTDHNSRSTFRVHRLVAWEFCEGYDEKSGKTIVNHKDCDRSYPYYENLEWCTASWNAKYGFICGNSVPRRGEKSNFSLYTEDQIRKVCEMAESGFDRKAISKETGVKLNYLSDILGSKKWTHISADYNLPPTRDIKFKGFSKTLQNIIIEMIKEGETPKGICLLLGIPYNTIHKTAITNLRKKAYE